MLLADAVIVLRPTSSLFKLVKCCRTAGSVFKVTQRSLVRSQRFMLQILAARCRQRSMRCCKRRCSRCNCHQTLHRSRRVSATSTKTCARFASAQRARSQCARSVRRRRTKDMQWACPRAHKRWCCLRRLLQSLRRADRPRIRQCCRSRSRKASASRGPAWCVESSIVGITEANVKCAEWQAIVAR